MGESKYIHYCWFGRKPLPKLAKKCLESWKKYFPDYEIICWNEDNCDFDECEFVKQAYAGKHYAFVADYVRAKALYEKGGIYFDTDMEITKNIEKLLEKYQTFLGVEDTGKVACGIWYEKYPKGYLPEKLLEKYRSYKNVDFEKRAEFAIPLLVTEILEPCGFDYRKRQIQNLENEITIFPRDYFYPYSYNRDNNLFTENTAGIHYYDASWLPVKSRIENYLVRHYGRSNAIKMIKAYQRSVILGRKAAKAVLFPAVIWLSKRKKLATLITPKYKADLERTLDLIQENRNADYLVLHNGGWMGVTSATVELFENTVDCRELYLKEDIKRVARAIVATKASQVIFSGVAEGWAKLAQVLKGIKPELEIKVFWHGSMSQVLDPYGWKMHTEIMKLCREGKIQAFATCKESLYEFYKKEGINVYFITNKVDVEGIKKEKKSGSKTRIGLYAASPANWRKNMFSQIAAVALMEDVVLDIVPLDAVAEEFAKKLNLQVEGIKENLKREELIARMSRNDVNLYVTFSECSPMLPLESLEMGVPCVTGNNHHYFANNKTLGKYLLVSQEDDARMIKTKITECIQNKKAIMEAYQKFRKENLAQSRQDVKDFLENRHA